MRKLSILLFLVVVCGCAVLVVADDSGATADGVSSVASANNLFALEMYSNISASESGNIFFSPYSISTAMSMVYEGAVGETAEQIGLIFHFPVNDSVRHSSVAAVYNALNNGSGYTLSTANALWVQEDYPFLENYLGIVSDYYAGEARNLDFVNDSEGSRNVINSWVAQKTNNKIVDILAPGSLNEDTRLVLTNAIYFKGKWAKQFELADTEYEFFYLDSGESVTAPLMRITSDSVKFNYAETDDLQILEMPYEGDDISMIILLPKDNNLSNVENLLTSDNLNVWRNNLSSEKVHVYLPRFTFETKYSLKSVLSGMGMPLAFTPFMADLSGMDGTQDLYIDFVIHQAFVDVNEEGTEAAAATAIGIGATSAEIDYDKIYIFRADHPFIFIIQDKTTGNILFLGRMMNPLE
ncbi:proteinase IV [archaeon CG07_land_8_20_14_0_80_38_8]|nr:MAG: proteinase IV [archaeon CG07_land_8_20_14_0_80_38_8]PIU89173.1 MAG: proteinase IV [archaeon CG06_land_8_20_14_3_00_37_11]